MMWEDVSPRAREIAEKSGLQSFDKMGWHKREHLEELTDQLIPRLRSELYDAMRDSEAPTPELEQDPPAKVPTSQTPRSRPAKDDDGARKTKRKTFF